MKKTGLVLVLFALLGMSSAYADLFGDLASSLNSLTDDGKIDVIEAALPEGRDIGAAIYEYCYEDLIIEDKKIISADANLVDYNPIENKWVIDYTVIFKFGIMTQGEDARMIITSDGSTFSVGTESLYNYSADKKGNKKTEPSRMSKQSCTEFSKNLSAELLARTNAFDDNAYTVYSSMMIYNLDTFSAVNKYAPNTIKAKKWHKDHPVSKHAFIVPVMNVVKIDMSDIEGYEYKVTGSYFVNGTLDVTFIDYYTNNEIYIDLNEGDPCAAMGLVADMRFDELTTVKGPYFIERIKMIDVSGKN